jgi:tetratricopeptide (TPR) repeat protein
MRGQGRIMRNQPQVFISYQRSDADFARRLREHLSSAGVRTWMDAFDIPVGAYWPDEIDKGLAASDIVVGVLSPDSVESRNVKNEWDWSIANQRPLVLIQTAPCVIPHRYVSINFIDATHDPDGAMKHLTAALGRQGSVVALPLAGTTVPVHALPDIELPPDAVHAAPPERADPFVGRERELAEATAVLDGALAGQRQLLLLSGEPGIGKTRIVGELAAIAERRGARVCWGRCFEWEGAPAFWPWVEILRHYTEAVEPAELRAQVGGGAAFIAQIVPEVVSSLGEVPDLPPMNPEQARFRLFDATARLLQSASSHRPLVVVIDDLHWADEASLLLLEFVARELTRARLLLVGAYRNVEVRRDHPLARSLASMTRTVEPRRIALKGIPVEGVAELIREITGVDPLPSTVAILHDNTEGNPFFVSEIVRLLHAEGQLQSNEIALAIPESVRDVIGQRLDRLSSRCNQVLKFGAVIGREFSVDLLAHLLGIDIEATLGPIDEALKAQMVEETGTFGRYRFNHALIQTTLYDELTVSERVRLHGQVAEAIERLRGNDLSSYYGDLSRHFAASPIGENLGKAIDYGVLAGRQAEGRVAWESAAQYFSRAAELLQAQPSADPGRRCEVLLALGEAQNRAGSGAGRAVGAGNSAEAAETFMEAARIARAAGLTETFARAAFGIIGPSLAVAQGFSEASDLLSQAVAALPHTDSALYAQVLGGYAAHRWTLLAIGKAPLTPEEQAAIRAHADEAVAVARRLDNASALSYVLHARCNVYFGPDDAEMVAADAEDAVAAAVAADDAQLHALALFDRYQAALFLGDFNTARATADELLRVAPPLKIRYFDYMVGVSQTGLALCDGRFADAEQHLTETLKGWPMGGIATGLLCVVRREQDRSDEVVDALRWIHEQLPAAWLWTALWIQVLLDTGQQDLARTLFEDIPHARLQHPPSQWIVRFHSICAEICTQLADRERAALVYDQLYPYADHNIFALNSDHLCGSAQRYLGLLATTLGRWEAAEQHFQAAIATNERWKLPIAGAWTRYDWADMLARRSAAGDRYRALDLLDEARVLADEFGLVRLTRMAATLRDEQLQRR